MLKQARKYVLFGAVALSLLSALAALVDTDGNAATNQTLLGDIDMGVGTLGDLKTFVSTGAVEEAKNFTRTNAVMWHDNVASNITVGPVNSIGNSSLSFSDEDGNYNIGYCSIAFGYSNSVGDYSSAFGDDNFVGHYASAFGEDNDIGSSAFAVGDRNQLGSYSYAFGFDNYARIDDGDGGYSYKDLAFLMGVGNLTEADGSFIMGVAHHAGEYAQASFSFGTTTEALHPGAFVWNFYPTNYFDMSVEDIMALPRYQSHGIGSFNINPIGGLSNFWVGETNMSDHVVNIVAPLALGMKNQVISDLEDGDIIPLKTDNLRSSDGDADYTATDLLINATNASVFAINELARTNSVLANGPYVKSLSAATNYANTVAEKATNYTDYVAGEFEDGIRTAGQANFASEASSASSANYLYGERQFYTSSDLITESTNAAQSVVGEFATTGHVASAVSKTALSGKVYDFADMRGVYISLSNLIYSLGGSVTNFPTFQE